MVSLLFSIENTNFSPKFQSEALIRILLFFFPALIESILLNVRLKQY